MYHMENKKKSYVYNQIVDAFMLLLADKPMIDITVTEMCKKAGVGRASFYRFFSSTSDVLDCMIDNLYQKLHELIDPIIDSSDSQKWRNFLFQYVYFLNSPERKILETRMDNFSIVLNRFIERILNDMPMDTNLPMKDRYDFSAKISMVNGVLLIWQETGMKDTPEEIVNYLMGIIDFYHKKSDSVNT